LADLVLAADRPYTLVTTVIQAPGRRGRAQLDLHLPSADLRLRFADRASLFHFALAVFWLAGDTDAADPHRSVRSRLLTAEDPCDELAPLFPSVEVPF
jgi:hypothetical protein